jgi:gliding motility-associated-like protein
MKHSLLLTVVLFMTPEAWAGEPILTKNQGAGKPSITFTENKGQVSDQNYKPRPDVLFGGTANGMVFHLRNDGISYQLHRVDTWKEDTLSFRHDPLMAGEKRKVADQITTYRLDVNWINCNNNFKIIHDNALPGYSNYYHEVCPDGVHHVKTYTGVTYKNIYNGIDLHYYEKNGILKYDYIISPNTDYRQIQLQIEGAEKITLQKDGSVSIKTALGIINEGTPLVYQNRRKLSASWILKNNILSFEIKNYNPALPLIIDPAIRIWGTYYGGNGDDHGNTSAIDTSGNVFLGGATSTSTGTIIATSGTHQTTLTGGFDCYLVKFNPGSNRLWGTYYGGMASETNLGCCTDRSGNVYVTGNTGSANGISTPGSHQPIFAGGGSAFLVKFDSNGVRQWGTYYGGPSGDEGYSCSTDVSGSVYLTGRAYSSSGFTTSGCHQSAFGGGGQDAFLAKFNSNGVRQWGTYYGGVGSTEYGLSCSMDAFGSVYITGTTSSTNNIATPGVHQNTLAGNSYNAFLAKFDSNGVRLWGTYYGGMGGGEIGRCCTSDAIGNVYLCGTGGASGGTAVATPGSHQSIPGGGADGFLVKFSASGIRQWGTYYGGTGIDGSYGLSIDALGNIFMCGQTSSSSGTTIATPGDHQSTYSGGWDGMLVKFNSSGIRQWGTYYGGTSDDPTFSCLQNGFGSIYITGTTYSFGLTNPGTTIASPGSHQSVYGGGSTDAFLVKFFDACTAPSAPTNTTPPVNQILCTGNTSTLNAIGTGTISWYSSPTGTTVLGTGTVYTTPVLSTGNYTFYAEDVTCARSDSRTAITITVNPLPTITVNNGSICSGSSFTINPTGANTYTITGGNYTVSPSSTTIYSITGTDSFGCSNSATVSVDVVSSMIPITTFSYNGPYCTNETNPVPALVSGFSTGGTFGSSPGLNINSSTGIIDLSKTNPGNYLVNYNLTASGCTVAGSGTANIVVNALVTLSLNPEVTISSGSNITLSVTGASSYSWSPSDWLSCTTCSNPVASPLQTTQYCVSSPDACVLKTCLLVKVNDNNPCGVLNVPNAFTPNNDLNNDEFCLQGWSKCVNDFSVLIFDRWGEKVFESTDPNFCWNGFYKGKVLERDVFVYIIKASFNDGSKTTKKGNITLIR